MFETLNDAIRKERQRLEVRKTWLANFRKHIVDQDIFDGVWQDPKLINKITTSVPQTSKIAGVDGGLISEAMTGFDLVLYRAVGVIFRGIGEKVDAQYIPNFNPSPQIFFSSSLSSRQEFSKIATLMRLYSEYEVARMTVEQENPTVLFLDGKVVPLKSDFITDNTQSSVLKQAELDVKMKYRELVEAALNENVLLCGIVKDSRSRDFASNLGESIADLRRDKILGKEDSHGWVGVFNELQDDLLAAHLLEKDERLAWLEYDTPLWLPASRQSKIWATMLRPVVEDSPVRLEILVGEDEDWARAASEIALGSVVSLCQHGLPLAIPTIILEADERTKLNQEQLDLVLDQISLSLGIPKDQLRKRRYFTSGLSSL